jgi:hypothetical protein
MSNLLEVVRFRDSGKMPLLIDDILVNPETAPYLVSSTQGLVWVEKAGTGNKIRAAVNHDKIPPGHLFFSVIQEVAARSRSDSWGSVRPFTREGLKEAVAYLNFYELLDFELLVSSWSKDENSGFGLGEDSLDIPVCSCSWLPKGWAVLVPRDRSFVGTLGHLSNYRTIVIVHNASRGIAILNNGD